MASDSRSHELARLSAVQCRCPQCFSRDSTPTHPFDEKDADWHVGECDDCGLLYTRPRPSTQSWETLYPPDYGPFQSRVHDLDRWKRRARRDRWLLSICRPLPELDMSPSAIAIRALVGLVTRGILDPRLMSRSGSGRLLDVGCGSGNYLARMQALGWNVQGIDRSVHAVERARRQWGVPVIVGCVPGIQIPHGPFDLITMWEVLEHLEHPRRALASLRDRLSPQGRVVLSVPNVSGWASRRFGKSWVAWDLPRHLTHFTRETLVRMLESEGFAVTCSATVGHPSWIRRSSPKWSLYRQRVIASFYSKWGQRRGLGESLFMVAKAA